MKRLRYLIFLIILVSSFLFQAPVPQASAQSNLSIVINSIILNENEKELSYNIYFTIVDRITGRAMPNIQIKSSSLELLEEKQLVETIVKKPESPYYISLVLDASGSMLGAQSALQDAATSAIRNAPSGTQFTVLSFNEQIQQLSTFADSVERTINAIKKVKPESGKGTCLFDAAYKAVELLTETPPGRRSVVLFTDGRDELSNGNPCSKYTFDQVISLATQNDVRIPINTIGLGTAAINESELTAIANYSGGFSAIGSESELSNLFAEIMDSLQAQWLGSGFVYPQAGIHTAVFRVDLEDGSTLSSQFSFDTNRSYNIPAQTPKILLESIQFDRENNLYDVSLNIENTKILKSLDFSIWEKQGGVKILGTRYTYPNDPNPYKVSASGLMLDVDYVLVISGYDSQNNPILNQNQGTALLEHEFKYNPNSQGALIEISSVAIPKDLRLTITNSDPQNRIAVYEGWLINESNNTQLSDSIFTVNGLNEDDTIFVPMSNIPNGKYTVILQALDTNGQILSRTEYNGIVYSAPKLGFFKKIGAGIQENPIILIAIVVIIIVFIAFLVINYQKNKQTTGTPALQADHIITPVTFNKSKSNEVPVVRTEFLSINNLASSNANTPSKGLRAIQAAQLSQNKMDKNFNTQVDVPEFQPIPPSQKPALAHIIVEKSNNTKLEGQKIAINNFPFTIGRNTQNDCIIDDNMISKFHAEITYDPSQQKFYIKDKGSTNGTWIKGKRIPSDHLIYIGQDQIIRFGTSTQIIFKLSIL
ncbi:MAG: hypothetical protein CL609_10720 [Anaerolineaceae bacterium]|nr:hypothetical protein [Anaerolineaceae bacterium]